MSKKTFRYGKNTRPSWVEIKEKDGRSSILHGNREDGSKHGHTVIKDKDVVYARTAEGRTLVDKKTPKKEKELRDKLKKFMNRGKNRDKDISGR